MLRSPLARCRHLARLDTLLVHMAMPERGDEAHASFVQRERVTEMPHVCVGGGERETTRDDAYRTDCIPAVGVISTTLVE